MSKSRVNRPNNTTPRKRGVSLEQYKHISVMAGIDKDTGEPKVIRYMGTYQPGRNAAKRGEL